jgi:HSP20 family molecular chaperone IbpA
MQEEDGSNATYLPLEAADERIQQNYNVLQYERFKSFQSRSFHMPNSANLSSITAMYADGVLTVDISKSKDVLEVPRPVCIA